MWEQIKKYWSYFVSGLLGLLSLGFLWERNKRKDAESKVENAEYDKNAAVTTQAISDIEKEKEALTQKTEQEKSKQVSDQEILDSLKGIK